VENDEVRITCGVPQGSVLGPTLWNIVYDEVLHLEVPVGVRLIAFADDLAVVATERTEKGLENMVDQALEKVAVWMENTELRLATKKTEAVMMVGKRRPKDVVFHLRGQEIYPQRSVRYLGIRIDRAMNFGPHVEEAAGKAEKMAGLPSRPDYAKSERCTKYKEEALFVGVKIVIKGKIYYPVYCTTYCFICQHKIDGKSKRSVEIFPQNWRWICHL
jgi:hypothetical protein